MELAHGVRVCVEYKMKCVFMEYVRRVYNESCTWSVYMEYLHGMCVSSVNEVCVRGVHNEVCVHGACVQ